MRMKLAVAIIAAGVLVPVPSAAGPHDQAFYRVEVYGLGSNAQTSEIGVLGVPLPIDTNFDGLPDRTLHVGGVPAAGQGVEITSPPTVPSMPVPPEVRDALRRVTSLAPTQDDLPREVREIAAQRPGSMQALAMSVTGTSPVNGFRPHGVKVTIVVSTATISLGYETTGDYGRVGVTATQSVLTGGTTSRRIEMTGTSQAPRMAMFGGFSQAGTEAELRLGLADFPVTSVANVPHIGPVTLDAPTRSAAIIVNQKDTHTTAEIRTTAREVSPSVALRDGLKTFSAGGTLPGFPGSTIVDHSEAWGRVHTVTFSTPEGLPSARFRIETSNGTSTTAVLAQLIRIPSTLSVTFDEWERIGITTLGGRMGSLDVNFAVDEALPALLLSERDAAYRFVDHAFIAKRSSSLFVSARVRELQSATVAWRDPSFYNGVKVNLVHGGGRFVVNHDDYQANRYTDVTIQDLPDVIDASIGTDSPRTIVVNGSSGIGVIEGEVLDLHLWHAMKFKASGVPASVSLTLAAGGDALELNAGTSSIGSIELESKSPPTLPWSGPDAEVGSGQGIFIQKNGGKDGNDGEHRMFARISSLQKLKWTRSITFDPGRHVPSCVYRIDTAKIEATITSPGAPFRVSAWERLTGKTEYFVARLSNMASTADLTGTSISKSCGGSGWQARATDVTYTAASTASSLVIDTNLGDEVRWLRSWISPLPSRVRVCRASDAYCYTGLDVPRRQGSIAYDANSRARLDVDLCMKDGCKDRVLVENLNMKKIIGEFDVNDQGNGSVYVDTRGGDPSANPVDGIIRIYQGGGKLAEISIPAGGLTADKRYVLLEALSRACGTNEECRNTYASCPATTGIWINTGIFNVSTNLADDICTYQF